MSTTPKEHVMKKPAKITLAEIGLQLVDALHEISEELQELRKVHTAMPQQMEPIPMRGPPAPDIADLQQRYNALFDAGEFRTAAAVYAALLAAQARHEHTP
jgi:hypothetical protein